MPLLRVVWLTVGLSLGLPSIAAAQSAASGAIAGNVRDTTGAVLPGVTVEVASPALIEKVRATVTDGQGSYRITDLRPGTYSVTFRLQGFSTVRREGIELTTGFTAPANAELSVGSIDETVTVTGASPVVDIQNTRSQNVITSTVLDALPTNKNIQGFAAATVGVTFDLLDLDVGGNRHERGQMRINGGPTMKTKQDGMVFNSIQGTADGQFGAYAVNLTAVQEVALELSGISAESESGGVQLNYVPKDGSNRFSGTVDVEYGSGALQSSNLNDDLIARGLATTTEAKVLYDVAEAIGGPIKRDRLWFFHSGRWWGGQEYQPGAYFNSAHGRYIGAANSGVAEYIPDLDRRAYTDGWFSDYTLRVTWQAAAKHKVTVSNSMQKSCICYFDVGANVAPEASIHPHFYPVYVIQSTWSSPATSRLLFEGGFTYANHSQDNTRSPMSSDLDIVLIESLGTATVPSGLRYNATGSVLPSAIGLSTDQNNSQANFRGSASYITGSHAVKVGVQGLWGSAIQPNDFGSRPVNYTLRAGVPVQITQFASPHYAQSDVRVYNVYAQDQWTIDRLTLNLGARYDHFGGIVPAQVRPAGPFVAAIEIAEIGGDALPSWNSVVPRLGAAYDLFGTGKTAVKASIGRYMASAGGSAIDAYNPATTISTTATRTWTDSNGNFVPECDLTSVSANGECGARSNANFGKSVVNDQRDAVLLEDGRAYNWQAQVSVSHELRTGWGVEVAYNRTWYGNFLATDNSLVTPANFDPYCVTAPVDARLPQGGGYQICGLYDVKPASFGQVSNLITQADNFGEQTQVYNGLRITSNARFTNGALLTAGMSLGRTVTDYCYQNDLPDVTAQGFGIAGTQTPRSADFCLVTPPWGRNWQFKLNGVYPLPWWGIQTSGVLQVIPGAPINAARSYTNAEIVPFLGRNLSACPATGLCNATVNVALYPNDVTLFEPRIVQLDWRFGKIFRFGSRRLEGSVDIYNLLNEDTVITQIATYGPTWQRPTRILAGRTVRLGAQFNF